MSFLDVDRSSLENALLLDRVNNTCTTESENSMDSLIDSIVHRDRRVPPTKTVTPIPGICVKTHTVNGEKIFINVCHTSEVPYPKGMTIPMSIGNEKIIEDRDGKPCVAFDVAVNTALFNKNRSEIMILTVVEAVANKHGLRLRENEFRVLKNVKCKGEIQPMNIEQRDVKSNSPKKALISEMTEESKSNEKRSGDATKKNARIPDFNLMKLESPRKCFVSEIYLENVASTKEISLRVGENRVLLTTVGEIEYEVDFLLPENIETDACVAEYDTDTAILTLLAPARV